MYHYTYQITNLINNKIYYGVRSCACLPEEDTKYWGSGIAIKHAYKKYGNENFKKEIDKTFETREDANLYEAVIVDIKWVGDKNTYNLTTGGLNGIPSEETRKKFSEAKRGVRHPFYGTHRSEETKRRISQAQKGKIISEESKQKMRDSALKGKDNPYYGVPRSEETKRKISEATMGRKVSEETRKKISKSISKIIKGEGNPFYGKHHSKETRDKLASYNSQNWLITNPEGGTFEICNLEQFCRDNNLHASHMGAVAKGRQRTHKGWKCKKL